MKDKRTVVFFGNNILTSSVFTSILLRLLIKKKGQWFYNESLRTEEYEIDANDEQKKMIL